MAIPANITPETAKAISNFPYQDILDVSDAPDGNMDYEPDCNNSTRRAVWYKHIATIADSLLAISADVTNPSGNYHPILSVWTYIDGILTELSTLHTSFCGSCVSNLWFQVPLDPGTTYYFEITDAGTTLPLNSNLNLLVKMVDAVLAPAGSLVIPDDTATFPSIILSANDGTVLQATRRIAYTEIGDYLPTGEQAYAGKSNNVITFLNSQLFQNTTWTLESISAIVLTSDHFSFVNTNSNKFYVLYVKSGVTYLQQFTAKGVAETLFTLPSNAANSENLAVNAVSVQTTFPVLFYINNDNVLRAYDLHNDIALPDIATLAVGESVGCASDGFCISSDGSTCISVFNDTVCQVRRYQHDGTFTNYDIVTVDIGRLEHFKLNIDGLTFWAWIQLVDGATSTFKKIQLSDGTILKSFDVLTSDISGVSGIDGAIFPISSSCPLMILAKDLLVGSGGLYQLSPNKTSDSVYTSIMPPNVGEQAIPDPHASGGFIADE